MLLLLFHIKDDRYALSCDCVHEVIPNLSTQPLPMQPDYIVGTTNYRGSQIPVVDLCTLFRSIPCSQLISTRIIIIAYPVDTKSTKFVGLLAEQVTETVKAPDNWQPVPATGLDPHFLEEEIIGHSNHQWFDPFAMLPDELNELLLAEKQAGAASARY